MTILNVNLIKPAMLALLLAGSVVTGPAFAADEGGKCDTIEGRDDGQLTCDEGLVCTGPFEGMYGAGNCQKPKQEGSLMPQGAKAS